MTLISFILKTFHFSQTYLKHKDTAASRSSVRFTIHSVTDHSLEKQDPVFLRLLYRRDLAVILMFHINHMA